MNPLVEEGKRLFNALARHSDIIMDVYVKGTLDERKHNTGAIEQLIQAGVLWRPELRQPVRLKSVVRHLLESSLKDERNRVLTGNVGSALSGLVVLAEHYKEAHQDQQYAQAQSYLAELAEHVYQLSETLNNDIRVLFSRINEEFGYVASVEAKIRENQHAQELVSKLLEQLQLFEFDKLSDVADHHSELRHLLVVTLQTRFARATQELAIVQGRLLALLGRFREFQGRTRLLKGFLLHQEQHPEWSPRNQAGGSHVPELFCAAADILSPAFADVLDEQNETIYGHIAAAISPQSKQKTVETLSSAPSVSVTEQTTVTLADKEAQAAVETLFEYVIDSGKSCSALDFYRQNHLAFDQEVWLYQLINAYQGLDEQEQSFIAMDWEGHADPVFTGNFYIQDIVVGLR